MAKGKHQASKTAQLLRDAQERVDQLEDELRRERAAAHDREQALNAEVIKLKGRLLSEVERLAEDRVQSAKNDAREAVAAAREEAERRVRGGLQAFSDGMTVKELRMKSWDDWKTTADAFGLSLGDFMALAGKEPPTSRGQRRIRPSQVNPARTRSVKSGPPAPHVIPTD